MRCAPVNDTQEIDVFWNGVRIGAIAEFTVDTPNDYGRWVPLSDSINERFTRAVQDSEESGELSWCGWVAMNPANFGW